MATIIAVHGTFAHSWDAPSDAPVDPQWWEPSSTYEKEFREHVYGQDGKFDVTHFKWSGDNSELGRRKAGRDLLKRMRALEEKNEPYVVVGHSHGGSVVNAALLQAAARSNPLPNMKRWITIGTPFVKMKREQWLFTRLGLVNKVLFIASMMLLLMFLVNLAATFFTGERLLFGRSFPGVLIVTGVMMSLPALLFYLWFYYYDRSSLLNYRSRALERAKQYFGPRWLSLAHTDDEAIQGLAFLPGAKLFFFEKNFAVPFITVASVVAVPLLYIWVLFSPAAMVGIADWLNTEVYGARSSAETLAAAKNLQTSLREVRDRAAGRRRNAQGDEVSSNEPRREVWTEYRNMRNEVEAKFPDLPSAERTLRFRQRFFEKGGEPCEGGKLCGGGHDLRYNSGLLLHVVTDELSWSLGAADQASNWRRNWITTLVLPALLVPVIFGLLSLVMMLVIRLIASLISRMLAAFLNGITNSEVKRAAFGNDTEGEIALGAVDRPIWLDKSQPRLPSALAELVTNYSNGMATRSFAKFRHAIGQLALAEPKHTADSAITSYFTWKELVHSAYFDVAEFRKLIMQAVSRSEGFGASMKFRQDPDYAKTAQWLAQLEGTPGTTATPGAAKPDQKDAAAVSAVVASTVKAQP